VRQEARVPAYTSVTHELLLKRPERCPVQSQLFTLSRYRGHHNVGLVVVRRNNRKIGSLFWSQHDVKLWYDV